MHVDGQQIIALGIVAVAASAIGRRLWGQAAAFRRKPGRGDGGGCDGCPSGGASKSGASKSKAPAAPAPLMQIQTRPPLHLRRPSAE